MTSISLFFRLGLPIIFIGLIVRFFPESVLFKLKFFKQCSSDKEKQELLTFIHTIGTGLIIFGIVCILADLFIDFNTFL